MAVRSWRFQKPGERVERIETRTDTHMPPELLDVIEALNSEVAALRAKQAEMQAALDRQSPVVDAITEFAAKRRA